jgi:hypothetical protein
MSVVPDPLKGSYTASPRRRWLWIGISDRQHRLLGRVVLLVLDGAAPTLLATDPPYGVQLDQTWRHGVYNGPRKRVKGWGVVAGAAKPYMMRDAPDGQPDGEDAPRASRGHHTAGHRNTSISMDTRADWSEAFALVPSLQVGYVWYASVHTLEVLQGLLDIGFELAGQIIWDKGLFSVGRSWYHWAHEPCFVVRRPGAPNLFIGEHDQATIWRAPSPKRIGGGSKERTARRQRDSSRLRRAGGGRRADRARRA